MKKSKLTRDMVIESFGSCKTCKFWKKSQVTPTLMVCQGDNGCDIVGENFFCGNFEKSK